MSWYSLTYQYKDMGFMTPLGFFPVLVLVLVIQCKHHFATCEVLQVEFVNLKINNQGGFVVMKNDTIHTPRLVEFNQATATATATEPDQVEAVDELGIDETPDIPKSGAGGSVDYGCFPSETGKFTKAQAYRLLDGVQYAGPVRDYINHSMDEMIAHMTDPARDYEIQDHDRYLRRIHGAYVQFFDLNGRNFPIGSVTQGSIAKHTKNAILTGINRLKAWWSKGATAKVDRAKFVASVNLILKPNEELTPSEVVSVNKLRGNMLKARTVSFRGDQYAGLELLRTKGVKAKKVETAFIEFATPKPKARKVEKVDTQPTTEDV